MNQIMGVLPAERVTPAPPFSITGVNYAGPLSIKNWYGRESTTSKCYICIFVCCTTRAVHIVSVLTTESFIACYRRFVARRGKPLKMLSDNGSNFIGAHNELCELAKFLKLQSES